MKDVTQQLADALRDTLDFLERHSNRWDGVNGKHPQLVVEASRQALTAFEASRAAPAEDVVERVARAIYLAMHASKGGVWEYVETKDVWHGYARAALSAMPRDEAALADLALDYLHLAQPEFCSACCPSVGREGEPIPHLPECVSMRSLLDGLPFATPGATISTGLMAKLKKLANYLTGQGEYEACDLIDTVVDRLSASPPTPARDDALEALLAKALRRLAFWAQTSGGTAGRDDGLVAAIDVGIAALRQYDTKLAATERGAG